MVTLLLLIITLLSILFVGVLMLSVGGTIFVVIFADVFLALAVIWFLFFRKKSKKNKVKESE